MGSGSKASVPITQRQARFVQGFALHGNGSKAARQAGYSAKTAGQISSENLKKPEIQEALSEFRRGIEDALEVSRERVLIELQEAIEMAKSQSNAGAMIAGWREIAKICGYYEQSKETKVTINIAAKRVIEKMETLTDAELLEIVTDSTKN
jgi:phage terminase small subunit